MFSLLLVEAMGSPPPAGSLLWELEVPGAVTSSPALAADGTIYFGHTVTNGVLLPNGQTITLTTNFLCAASAGGQKLRETEFDGGDIAVGPNGSLFTGGLYSYSSSILPGGGTVFVHQNIALSAFDQNGDLLWKRADAGPFALGADGSIVTTISFTNEVNFQLRPGLAAFSVSGALLWQITNEEINFSVGTQLAIAQDSTIFMGPQSVVTTTTALPTGGSVTTVTTNLPVAFDGEGIGMPVLLDSEQSQHYRSYDEFISKTFGNSVIGSDGTVYFGTAESNLCATSASGEIKWQFPVGALIATSPALANDGTIYCITEAGRLHAVSADGMSLWEFDAGGTVHTSPVIGTNGVIYFGTDNGKLIAIQGSAPPARSPWPMYRHDAQHTGRTFQNGLRAETPGLPAQLQLRLSVEPDIPYLVEYSSDLVHWQSSFTYSGEGGILRVSRPSTATSHFYRMKPLLGGSGN